MDTSYDPDAFDSMAVMNSEIWNFGEARGEGGLTPMDLLPNVRGLSGTQGKKIRNRVLISVPM